MDGGMATRALCMLIGCSLTVPVTDGRISLGGDDQHIIMGGGVNSDARPEARRVSLVITGHGRSR